MQVFKINFTQQYSFKGIKVNNQYDYSRNKLFIPQEDIFCKTDTCTCEKEFIKTKGKFRELAGRRTIHCPYCGLPMLSIKTFFDMKNRGVFSSPIKDFVREVKPYRDCLKPGNKEVFDMIDEYSEQAPQTHLSRVIRLMYKDSLKKLREAQKPIFMEFARTAAGLPEERKPAFRKFMELQRYKLLEIPHIEPFNSDDFQYKIKKMTETLENSHNKSMLISLSECIAHPAFDNTNIEIPDAIIKKIFGTKINHDKCRRVVDSLTNPRKKLQFDNNCLPVIILSSPNNKGLRQAFIRNMAQALQNPDFNPGNIGITREIAESISKLDPNDRLAAQNLVKKDIQLYIINQIRLIGEKLDRDDIKYICKISKNMLMEKPIVMQFSNKAFMIDLLKQLKGLEKTDIYYKLTDIAKKLPDSASNKNSFIAKHKLSNSDTIGYYLLRPSVATIEHIKPTHDKGNNNMGNWALACEADNNKRMHTKQSEFLRKFPPKNPHIYFAEIIEASIDGEIDPSDVFKQAQAFKKEGDVIIDTSRLKEYYNL